MRFSSIPHFQVKNLLQCFGGSPFTNLVMGRGGDTSSEQVSQEEEVINVQSKHHIQHWFHKTAHCRAACHHKISLVNWSHGILVLLCVGHRLTIKIRVGNAGKQKSKRAVLPRGGSKQCMLKGKPDSFAAPFPIQPRKQCFWENHSNNVALPHWYHIHCSSFSNTSAPQEQTNNSPQPKQEKHYTHLSCQRKCPLYSEIKKFIIFWKICTLIMLLKDFIMWSFFICKAVFLFQSQAQTT